MKLIIIPLVFLPILFTNCSQPAQLPTPSKINAIQVQSLNTPTTISSQSTINTQVIPTLLPTETIYELQAEVTKTISNTTSATIFDQTAEPGMNWRPPLYPTPWVPTEFDHFYFSRPIAAADLKWILANYRYGGVFFAGVVHTGVDIPVISGTKVYAAGQGRVNWVGYGLLSGRYNPDDPYGMAIVIRHDFGYQGQTLYTVYGHLSKINVIAGQYVETGEKIGLSGATGKVTGAHLHFEVRIGRNSFSRSRNPELWLSPPQGWGILAGKILNQYGEPLLHTEVIIKSEESGKKWTVKSYGGGAANSDPYYKENMVIGDLPAGKYTIWIPTETSKHGEIEINPGMVSFFTYLDGQGFNNNPPAKPHSGFKTPLPLEETPIP